MNQDGTREASQAALEVAERLLSGLQQVIRGRDDTLKLVIAALFADGHVLLEDYPGSGKTTLTKTLGALIETGNDTSTDEHILPFRRIQFTPDMLPGDVLGVNVFDPQAGSFHFIHGPVFAHVVLADEINRTGPKVQAAFLECMAEKQVTIDNVTYPLDELFFVVGTQNPLDLAGTYPLPLVQLDRFLFKIPMSYVDSDTEFEILQDYRSIEEHSKKIEPLCKNHEILLAREAARQVHVSADIRQTIVDIVQATRKSPLLQFGASTRAAIMTQRAIQAWAIVVGREYCTEDDLKYILPYVLPHRLGIQGNHQEAAKVIMEIAEPHLEKLIRKA